MKLTREQEEMLDGMVNDLFTSIVGEKPKEGEGDDVASEPMLSIGEVIEFLQIFQKDTPEEALYASIPFIEKIGEEAFYELQLNFAAAVKREDVEDIREDISNLADELSEEETEDMLRNFNR